MSLSSLHKAEQDQAVIAAVKENIRSHLLMALSEARSATLSLEPDLREKLLDDLAAHFHPDARMTDAFSDGFTDAERAAERRVENIQDDLALIRREPVYATAAE